MVRAHTLAHTYSLSVGRLAGKLASQAWPDSLGGLGERYGNMHAQEGGKTDVKGKRGSREAS